MKTEAKMLEIETPSGPMPAYLSRPEADAPRPAVVVLMEAFGLVPNLKSETDRIARMGYVAIAPDLYHRLAPDNTAGYDELPKAIGLMGRLSDDDFLEDMRATLDHLKRDARVRASSIGVMGFCMGGRLAFLSACALPGEIRACAPFYGGGIGQLLDRAGKIRCPLHLFFGELDFFIPQEEVATIGETLTALGVDHAIETYEGAVHGFCCQEREEYHAEAARDAFSRLEAFFAANL
jgi:carboxymethylenebutenolidase